MFKDYYQILGISRDATSIDVKAAYRAMSMKWHPDRNQNMNVDEVTRMMQDINEAYAMLKDDVKRARYDKEYDEFLRQRYQQQYPKSSKQDNTDYEQHYHNSYSHKWDYDYDIKDENLRQDIHEARDLASQLVTEFMQSFKKASKDAAAGAWDGAKGYVWVAIAFAIIGLLVQLCSATSVNQDESYQSNRSVIQETPQIHKEPASLESSRSQSLDVSDNWTNYSIDNNAFSIAIPNTLELRKKDDCYVKRLKDNGFAVNEEVVVFQQRGLSSSKVGTEDNHYCRVMIAHYRCASGEVYTSSETELLVGQLKQDLRDMVEAELAPGQSFLEEPTFKWIDINGIKAIDISYRRSGNKGNTTRCTIYLMFNSNEYVKMIVAYRESEANLWAKDMKKVIKTFRWL